MALRIGASGLRSSCESVAMKSSFCWSASRRICSTCLRSLMSITMPRVRSGLPSAPYSARPW